MKWEWSLLLPHFCLVALHCIYSPRQNKKTQRFPVRDFPSLWDREAKQSTENCFFLQFSANLELLRLLGEGWNSRQTPEVLRQAGSFPGLLLSADKPSHNMDFVVRTLSSALPLVRAHSHSSIRDQPRRQTVMNHRYSWISAEQRTPALGNFLALVLTLIPVEKQVISQ